MSRPSFAMIVALTLSAAPGLRTPQELVGLLEGRAVPGDGRIELVTMVMSDDARAALGALVPAGASVGKLGLPFPQEPRIEAYLVERSPSAFTLIADFDRDGRIGQREHLAIPAGTAARPVVVPVRLPGGVLDSYPVAFEQPRRRGPLRPGGADSLLIKASSEVILRGTVPIAGRPVAFALAVNPIDGRVVPERDLQYVDTNGDGQFDRNVRSWERASGLGRPSVFRVNDTYLSVKTVDVARGRVTFATHPAADYERIELRRGAPLPDFAFVDLEGRPRRLAEFRGKHLLLDFWGTWCAACIAHLPVLTEARERFRARGFDILGMDHEIPDDTAADLDEGLARAQAFVLDRGITWTQARTASIKTLSDRRFRIGVWPTYVLIDPEGRILSVDRVADGELRLSGPALLDTLDAILPRAPGGR